MSFGFSSLEHAFASAARDVVKTANVLSVVSNKVGEASPEIEAVTGTVYPPAVLIERAAFGLLGTAAKAANDLSETEQSKGLNLNLDAASVQDLKTIAKYLQGRLQAPAGTSLPGLPIDTATGVASPSAASAKAKA
jgi:hypothetical protein